MNLDEVGLSKKSLDNLRDCVKEALNNGSQRGHEFRKMRHAIILELKRLGYNSSEIKDKLLEWNEKCEKPLNISEQRIQLLKYVEWVEGKECKLGCNALEDYCLGKDRCQFHKRISYQKRQETQELPFNIEELDKFLEERYKADGLIMMLIVKALRLIQLENATGEAIYAGFRKISSVIRDRLGHFLAPMDIFRKMRFLVEEGVLEQIAKGKPGNFSWQANGYRFLGWKHP
ncbi:hypothetical protein ACFL1I_08540 [Candidatus Omnitrophota bacterium]